MAGLNTPGPTTLVQVPGLRQTRMSKATAIPSLSVTRTYSLKSLSVAPTARGRTGQGQMPIQGLAQGIARDEESGVGELCQDLNIPSRAPWICNAVGERWPLLHEKQQRPPQFRVLSIQRLSVHWHPCPLATDSISLRKCSPLGEPIIPSYWK